MRVPCGTGWDVELSAGGLVVVGGESGSLRYGRWYSPRRPNAVTTATSW
jgi:hypothetical protein